jgi:hypothetical protein
MFHGGFFHPDFTGENVGKAEMANGGIVRETGHVVFAKRNNYETFDIRARQFCSLPTFATVIV